MAGILGQKAPPAGILGQYQNTPDDYMTQGIMGALLKTGVMKDERAAYRQAQKFTNLLDWTPAGVPQAAYQAGGMFGAGANAGSVPQMALGASMAGLMLLPGGNKIAPEAEAAAQQGIKAYHGSPYLFDKFDASKIGTGEGAQAFGHGLYFAEGEPTAKAYRDTLSAEKFLTPSGEMFDPTRDLKHVNVRARFTTALRKGDDPVASSLARAAELSPDNPTYPLIQRDISTLQNIQASGGLRPTKGHMYEVNIAAHPDHFLDFDKPYQDQSPQVQQAIDNLWTAKGGQLEGRTNPAFTATADHNGEAIHAAIATTYGGPVAASDALKAQGIPGIKYLDQGSRTAGDGTRNYVVFNPDLVNITRRYAIPATAGATALGAGLFGLPQQQTEY